MNSTGEAARPLSPSANKGGFSRFLRKNALQIAIVFVMVLIYAFFTWRSPQTFLAYDIYNSLMSTTPYFALVAIPLTLVIVAKEIDISFTSVMALGTAVFTVVYTATHNILLGFICCLAAGVFAGWLNGIIVVKLAIPSLVATIGTQFLWRGVVLIITNGTGMGMTQVQGSFLYPLFVGSIFGKIPAQFLWMIIFTAVVWFILNRTQFGAHVYLVGDNIDSARLMGVNVDRTKILTFTIVGFAAALTGYIVSEAVLFFWPTLGDGYLLNTLASVFLGGTSVFGGTGTIFGTFIGSLIIAVIQPGIVAAGWLAYWSQFIYGAIVVISVALQSVLRKRLT
jgi:simple sugar transport system permease protein